MSIRKIVTKHEDVGLGSGCQQIESLFPKMITDYAHVWPPRSGTGFFFGTHPVPMTPVSPTFQSPRCNPHPQYFTPRQLARRWNVHIDKVLTFIKSGTLAAFNVASVKSTRPRYRISIEAVAAFERDRSAGPPSAVNKNKSSRVRRQQNRPPTRTYF